MREMGPNAKKLFVHFLAKESVPDGGGMVDGIKFFTDPEHRKEVLERAERNFDLAMIAVKSTTDNPYGNDEEKICAEILRQLDQRRNSRE